MNVDKHLGSCDHHHNHDTAHFSHPTKSPCVPLQSVPWPYPLTPGNHWSTFCFYSFAFSRISYKLNHTVCRLLCLLEEVMERKWLPVDLRAAPRQSEVPHPSHDLGMYVLLTFPLEAAPRTQPWDSICVNMLLRPPGCVHDWTQVRPLYKFWRFWWAGAEISSFHTKLTSSSAH